MSSENTLLYTKGLTKRYRGTAANSNITIEIPRGKIVGFVGENGSGKTTFIRTVCKLIFPTSGTFGFNTADGKCRTGAIVESPSYHPNMSAPDNLRFQAKLCGTDEKLIPEILETVGLGDTGKKTVRHFSLGMRQRMGIGIALMSDPEFLILDEPTNGLDPQGIIEMREFLKELCSERNITLLISSHILSELSLLADHYIFIHKGEIIQSVSAEELFSRSAKQLRFRCEGDASAFLMNAESRGWAEHTEQTDGVNILYGPKDYSAILGALATLGVTELETRDDSLETRYVNLMGGEDR
ncbi:MAG: ATP-binding cassette domain-containing protein [Clostridia bacterium]|nr:ATP-binding cassette domain-containing protein [Clostridia bacterium]